MAESDYQILQAQVEFPSTSTPRVFYKLGGAVIGTIAMLPVKPNGTIGTTVTMTQLGGSSPANAIYYADIADSYALGQWQIFCTDTGDQSTTLKAAAIQWGGIADLIVQTNTQVDDMTVDVAVIKGEVTAGGDLFQNAEASRMISTNRFEVNAGTGIGTLYADDGTTPFATRTVENGDGSALSGAQVLKLGVLTPIP
jgi:hypothetical protein